MKTKIATIVGARPQFIKAAAVSRAIRKSYADKIDEVLIHTGQHYDENMSDVFFSELDIPQPKHNLDISGGLHGEMTGRMLASIEAVLIKEKPDWVLIYGDTNSTLAGALAAVKLNIPVAHVEAGLRSFNMRMPEEINRILSDRISSLLFCPTETAVENLGNEGITKGVYNTGDVMYDVALFYQEQAKQQSLILKKLDLVGNQFALATCHRAENTDDPARLEGILSALAEIAQHFPVIFPLHPRTRKLIELHKLTGFLSELIVTEPLAFLDMVAVVQSAKVILTDSGGVQKEAFYYGVPCVTMRDETEWVETIRLGGNTLAGASKSRIVEVALNSTYPSSNDEVPYGDGSASKQILEIIEG